MENNDLMRSQFCTCHDSTAVWFMFNLCFVIRIQGSDSIKMSSHHYMKWNFGDKTVVRSSYLQSGNSYTGDRVSILYPHPMKLVGDILDSPSIESAHKGSMGFILLCHWVQGSV